MKHNETTRNEDKDDRIIVERSFAVCYRLKVEQRVDGSGLGVVVLSVHLSPVFGPPLCDQDGEGCRYRASQSEITQVSNFNRIRVQIDSEFMQFSLKKSETRLRLFPDAGVLHGSWWKMSPFHCHVFSAAALMKPSWKEEQCLKPTQSSPCSPNTHWLTEVKNHAGENDESKPDAEVGDKVDDGDDDITDGREDAEQDVAEDKHNHRLVLAS